MMNNTNTRRRRFRGCFGAIVAIVVVFGLFDGLILFIFWIFGALNSPDSSFFLVQGDNPWSVSQLWIGGAVIWIIGAAIVFLGLKVLSIERKQKLAIIGLLVVTVLTLFTAFSIWQGFFNLHVGMTRTGFMRPSVEITDGSTLSFHNPANGVTQILCVGVDQRCQPETGDPSQLDRGLVIRPGQVVNVEFDTDGTYQITSQTTPHMNITITVTTSNTSS
jgi:hypothetical protein